MTTQQMQQNLKYLRDFIESHEIEAGCSDMNEKRCKDHDGRCDLCNFDKAVESLRNQKIVCLDDQGCRFAKPPRCTMNHHNDDGTLIIYAGEGKPCNACPERQDCFEAFLKYKREVQRNG